MAIAQDIRKQGQTEGRRRRPNTDESCDDGTSHGQTFAHRSVWGGVTKGGSYWACQSPAARSSRPKSGKSKLVSPVTSRSIGRTWGEHLGGKFCVWV